MEGTLDFILFIFIIIFLARPYFSSIRASGAEKLLFVVGKLGDGDEDEVDEKDEGRWQSRGRVV
jgi:hypothetical protein